MRWRPRTDDRPRTPTADLWTGQLRFAVTTHTGSTLGPADLLVEAEQVRIRFNERILAVLARDRVRDWLRRPTEEIGNQDVMLGGQGEHLTMAIGMAPPQHLPNDIAIRMRALI